MAIEKLAQGAPASADAQDQKVQDAEKALLNLCRASALVGLLAEFVSSGEHDMERWDYNVGEALLLAGEVLTDSFCALNDGDIAITRAQKAAEGAA